MAKTKTSHRTSKSSPSTLTHAPQRPRPRKSKPSPPPSVLLAQASALLAEASPDEALRLAQRAHSSLRSTPPTTAELPALNLLAQINLELGDGDAARGYFLQAASLDPIGEEPEPSGGGAEKFLWLAQLAEAGGRESVEWFERGCTALRTQIASLESTVQSMNDEEEEEAEDSEIAELEAEVEAKKRKLAEALCGVVEIYMTDLSLEADAEAQCERLIAEALGVAPDAPEPLQTLASVRISQMRVEEAREALGKSVALWENVDEDAEDSKVPDFPTRISLVRLLMEVSMLDKALTVLERLVNEDDQSVEAWYLGGWCLYLSAETKRENTKVKSDDGQEERKSTLKSSKEWLGESLRLYEVLEYEDDRLRDHALELVADLNREVGGEDDDGPNDGGEAGEWEDEDGDEDRDEDEKMEGA